MRETGYRCTKSPVDPGIIDGDMLRFSPRTNRAHLIRWREWGDAAFEEARALDRPVFLCITAFWCGVCQRLDETALSDENVAAVLNAFFLPVRIEESQRPDVDLRYNQNGWPTIVLLTPAGDSFLTTNAQPTDDLLTLLVRVVDVWQKDRASLTGGGPQATASGDASSAARPEGVANPGRDAADAPAPLGPQVVAEVAGMLEGLADAVHGGFGTTNKFFHHEANDFLLYLHQATGQPAFLDHARLTLDRLATSRMLDATGGGFYRYSSKPDWNEPHPEKLLEDQAALLSTYLHAYVLSGAESYRRTAEGLVDYLDANLWDEARGVFNGCQDYVRAEGVDSGGERALVPVIDRIVYTDANARAASAYLDAWWLLGRDECRTRAVSVLDVLWHDLRAPDGSMHHCAVDGAPQTPGLLVDAVAMGLALLQAHAVLDDGVSLDRARMLADRVIEAHRNPKGGFFDTTRPGPAALRVPLTVMAQNASLARFLTLLADLTGETALPRRGALGASELPEHSPQSRGVRRRLWSCSRASAWRPDDVVADGPSRRRGAAGPRRRGADDAASSEPGRRVPRDGVGGAHGGNGRRTDLRAVDGRCGRKAGAACGPEKGEAVTGAPTRVPLRLPLSTARRRPGGGCALGAPSPHRGAGQARRGGGRCRCPG